MPSINKILQRNQSILKRNEELVEKNKEILLRSCEILWQIQRKADFEKKCTVKISYAHLKSETDADGPSRNQK